MAEVLRLSWPIPSVVPPCTQPALLRSRHKVPRCSGSFGRLRLHLSGWFAGESELICSSPFVLSWLSTAGVSSRGKRPPTTAKCRRAACANAAAEFSAAAAFGVLNSPRTPQLRRWRCSRRYDPSDQRRCKADELSPRRPRAKSPPLRRPPNQEG